MGLIENTMDNLSDKDTSPLPQLWRVESDVDIMTDEILQAYESKQERLKTGRR